MLALFNEKLQRIEKVMASARPAEVPRLFREIPIDVFGKLLLDIPPEFPKIREFFPSMAPEEVQTHWTGSHGDVLLSQSLAFIKTLVCRFYTITEKNLETSRILDYGCGWGRLIRLLYKFTSFENIYAVDPWDQSIKQCEQHGIKGNLALSDWVPENLPFNRKFDLIFAFSVFTHLSETTAHAVLATLRKHIAEDGLLAITIRPKEFWYTHDEGKQASNLIADHDGKGYAFVPLKDTENRDDATYGDTTVSLDYFVRNFPAWELASVEYNMVDSYQVILFLKPAGQPKQRRGKLRN